MEYTVRTIAEMDVTEEEMKTIKNFVHLLSDYLYDVNDDRDNFCDMIVDMEFFNKDYRNIFKDKYNLDINIIDKKEN